VVRDLAAVDMACADPAATAARWAALLARSVRVIADAHEVALDAGSLRFLSGAAPGDDGVVAIDLLAVDRAAALATAAARGLARGADWVRICGTTLRFV
jgi:hypothetical protein